MGRVGKQDGAGDAGTEALRLLAGLILGQETGIADGSLIAAGGYVWPDPRAGIVPSFEEILGNLRAGSRRDGFWDDSGILGGG
jgi:hypothetical protein